MSPTLLNDRYGIIKKLGEGGFGDTFLAEDTQMPSKRRCVIKQLKPITTNPQIWQLVQERFEREAAILEKLGESNQQIPRLYAYFTTAGQFYLVQEWIEGQTLTQKVQQQGTLSENFVREILVSVLPVLDYVHSHRIVHRDIKPDNIILRQSDGKPVLIDFGAVRETIGTVITTGGNTARSIVIGTPGFMPSEQAAGRAVHGSDLYSLGLTAIYLLTGKLPQELETDPERDEILWQQHALNVSPGLAGALNKAIQSHPRDRYSSAKEMLWALQSNTSPIPATVFSPKVTIVVPNNSTPKKSTLTVIPPGQNGMLVGGAIATVSIGVLAIFTFFFKPPSPVANSTASPALTVTPSPVQSLQPPAPESQLSTASNTPEPNPSPELSPSPSLQPIVLESPTSPESNTPDSSPSPELPPSELRLARLLPTYESSAFSPADAFAKCPENTTLYLVGETESFKFAVCGNGAPSHCIVWDKINQKVINLTQAGEGFSDGSFTYEPPSYENSSYVDASLHVYDGNAVIADEKVIQLYKLAAQ